jgi:hypothetical protein
MGSLISKCEWDIFSCSNSTNSSDIPFNAYNNKCYTTYEVKYGNVDGYYKYYNDIIQI